MLVLLDECVPRQLRPLILGHDVRTIHEMGWAGQKNGRLLRLMADQRVEVFLTVDQNLRYQQNPDRLGVSVVILVARTNRLPDLEPLIPSVLQALENLAPGDVVEVTIQ